ncbi:MAG TPA: hypothetical protein PKH26_09085 [Phycisphaerae bacterium]|nr:hypothetical protein [Phycisphaerae bacterium]
MKAAAPDLDLVVLAADHDMSRTLEELLRSRWRSLHIRPPRFIVLVHPEHDPGCFRHAPQVLRLYLGRARHALVLFDHDGCGQEDRSAAELEADVRRRLQRGGWGDRAAAIVIVPELENWVWSDSPQVARALGWENHAPALRSWLQEGGLWPTGALKPAAPKDAMERALREVKKRWSSALFAQLAQTVALGRCTDPAFARLKQILSGWFGTPASQRRPRP